MSRKKKSNRLFDYVARFIEARWTENRAAALAGCVEYLHTRGMVQCRVEAYGAALADLTSAQAGMSPALDEELFAESWYYVGVAHTGLGQVHPARAPRR